MSFLETLYNIDKEINNEFNYGDQDPYSILGIVGRLVTALIDHEGAKSESPKAI